MGGGERRGGRGGGGICNGQGFMEKILTAGFSLMADNWRPTSGNVGQRRATRQKKKKKKKKKVGKNQVGNCETENTG